MSAESSVPSTRTAGDAVSLRLSANVARPEAVAACSDAPPARDVYDCAAVVGDAFVAVTAPRL